MLDPSDLSVYQADFNAVGVVGRAGKQGLYNTTGKPSGALVFFQHDIDFEAGFDMFSCAAIHLTLPSSGWFFIERYILRVPSARGFQGPSDTCKAL